MSYVLLLPILLVARLAAETSGQQPDRRPFPHFRPAEHRHLKHYKPKTWRERTPAPKLPATSPKSGRAG